MRSTSQLHGSVPPLPMLSPPWDAVHATVPSERIESTVKGAQHGGDARGEESGSSRGEREEDLEAKKVKSTR